jgi:hypothetical protein
LLKPIIEQVRENLGVEYVWSSQVTADAGFRCKDMIEYCADQKIDALVADGDFRKRDPHSIDRDRH